MTPSTRLLALALLAVAPALAQQQSLTTLNTLQGFVWPGLVTPNLYFDLNVATTVTIQGFDVNLDLNGSPAGVEGSVEFWTAPVTYVGVTGNQAAWTLRGTAPCVSAATQPTRVCLPAGVTLAPGSHGVALRYVGVRPLFTQGASTPVPGGTGPGTNQYYQNSHLTLLAGATQSQGFTSTLFAPYVWNGSIYYRLGAGGHTCATAAGQGAGCYQVNGSFHQRFASPALAAAALAGRSLSLLWNGSGYVLQPGSGVAYVPPTTGAQQLLTNDDGHDFALLTGSLPYPGGTTNILIVNANGYVCAASSLPIGVTPNPFTPNVPGLLNAPVAAWWSWHDYNPTEPGSGQVKFEQVGALATVTWDDVESYPYNVTNRSTLQMQFDLATGNVHYVWPAITAIGGSNYSDEHVIGFSPAGDSPRVAPIDVTNLVPTPLAASERFALQLDAGALPRLGSALALVTSRVPNTSVGLLFLGVAALPAPGVPLAAIGMPGCSAHVDIGQAVGNVIGNAGGLAMSVTLVVPNNPGLLGAQVYGQSLWLDPAANAFGALASNGLALRVGDF